MTKTSNVLERTETKQEQDCSTNLRHQAYLELVRTMGELSGEFAQLFKSHGVSDVQYNVLRILKGAKKPLQIYEIAERMLTPHPDISRLISRLETAGHIVRGRCQEDGRVVWIELTADGKKVLRKLAKPVDSLHASQCTRLSERELQTLIKLLAKSRKPE